MDSDKGVGSKSLEINIDDLIDFYQNKFTSFQGESVSHEAFNCFKKMFLIINEKLDPPRIEKVVSSSQGGSNGVGSYRGGNSGTGYSTTSYGNSYNSGGT